MRAHNNEPGLAWLLIHLRRFNFNCSVFDSSRFRWIKTTPLWLFVCFQLQRTEPQTIANESKAKANRRPVASDRNPSLSIQLWSEKASTFPRNYANSSLTQFTIMQLNRTENLHKTLRWRSDVKVIHFIWNNEMMKANIGVAQKSFPLLASAIRGE